MQYCEDPNQSGSYYPPKIIDKSKIESGECPQIDDNFDDIEMVDEDDDNRRDRGRRDRDRCKNCPYCESEVSFIFVVAVFAIKSTEVLHMWLGGCPTPSKMEQCNVGGAHF